MRSAALPDPSLGLRYHNEDWDISFGESEFSFFEVAAEQEVPFPGKLGLRERIALRESERERAARDLTLLMVLSEVAATHADLAVVERSGEILGESQRVLELIVEQTAARYAVGEAAPYARGSASLQRFARAVSARDWEQLASVFGPDFTLEDHRLLGWGTLSCGAYLAMIRALVDLAPDVIARFDHVLALDDRGTFFIGRWLGSREGGPFEIPFVAVSVVGPDGHIQRVHTYNFDQLDEARAQFEELRAETAA